MTTRRVAWRRSDEIEADEHCTLAARDSGLSLVGTVLAAEGHVPVRIEYRVMTDPSGFTTAVHVRDLRGFEQRATTLTRDTRGGWSVDGRAVRSLRGCTDVDLECTPSTNTLPIRRLRLGVGQSRTIQAARLTFPGLEVRKTAQTYERLDEAAYRYTSGTFESELTVDDEGVVIAYGPWRRTASATGGEDTEPLDAGR